MEILVLGSINMDLVVRGPKLPAAGETVLGGTFYQAVGGKGANQAVAVARAGRGPVLFVASAGDDVFGREALETLRHEGIDLDFVRTVADVPTGVAIIMVDERGENAISVASGANARLTPESIDALPKDRLRRVHVALASLEIPIGTVARGLAAARKAGATTVLNPAPVASEPIEENVLAQVDILTPNELELAALVKVNLQHDDHSAVEAAARRLLEIGPKACVVTLGSRGCLVVERNGPAVDIPAFQVEAVDATAAGDTFNGALAVALAEGQSLADAARFASRAAALSVTRRGALPSIPHRSEIEVFPT